MKNMRIINRYNSFCKFGVLIFCFIFLTGFEFEAMQKEMNSADKLISEKKYFQAEESLNSILNDLNNTNESGSEKDSMAKNMIIPLVYFKLGGIQYKQEKYEEGIPYFSMVLNFEMRSIWKIQAIYYLGMSEFYIKRYSLAREHFTRLVNDYKDSKPASEGQYYIGLCYELEGNAEESKAAFEKFLELYPGHAWAGKVKGKIK